MKVKLYKLNLNELFIFSSVILLVVTGVLTTYVSDVFSMVDEIYTGYIIIVGIAYLAIYRRNNLIKDEKKILMVYIAIVILGILGNNKSKFQTNNSAIIIETITWGKLFLTYIFLMEIMRKEKSEKYYEISLMLIKFLTVCSIILEILNLLKIIKLADGYDRFGIPSFSLFGHPSAASTIFAVAVAMLLYDEKKNKKWIYACLILEILTFRFKAIIFCCIVIYIKFFMKRKISFGKILFVLIIGIAIAWNQIEFYFLNSTASRAVALKTSVEIANDYFPLGSGLATFGTSSSGKYYSKAYIKYNLNNRWGFTEKNYAYIGDGGWATIIAQFGWLGTALFIYMIYLFSRAIFKRNKNEIITPYLAIISYILIASTNETIFISAHCVLFSLAAAILLNQSRNVKE